MRALRLVAAALLCVAFAAVLGGCGGHSRHQSTPAGTLLIYTSLPFEGPDADAARSIFDGERLALSQAGGAVNGYKVVLRPLDDASSSTRQWDPTLVTANASVAAGDGRTIAYLGELTPGSSLDSIPILSHAGILQVSPADTVSGLKGATFARVVPPDKDEAIAQLLLMQNPLHVKRLYVLKDRSTYGADIAAAATSNAADDGIDVVDPRGRYLGSNTRSLERAIARSKAGALLYAGLPAAPVAGFWNALSLANPTIKKFASAAITEAPSWAQTTVASRYNTFLSAPGLPRLGLPRGAGTQFINDFTAAYGSRVPWASGIFGYVAMSGVLNALYGLGTHINEPRERVLDAFLATANLPSALGTYSIVDGQTTFQHYFFTSYNNHGVAQSFTPSVS